MTQQKSSSSYKYDGFISYARASDHEFAPAVHSALQRFARSWTQKSALHIFLDKACLAGNPNLSQSIEVGLNESAWLLLMASPESAQSEWVQHEINWWLEHRSVSQLMILLTEGEIIWDSQQSDFDWNKTTALPDMLQGKIPSEPLYVDLRKAKAAKQFTLRSLVFRDVIAGIAAPLHHKSKDELDGEDVREYHKFIIMRRIVVTLVISMLLGIVGLSGWSFLQRNKAIQNRIDSTVNAAENALYAHMEIESLVSAVTAGRQLEDMSSTLNHFILKLADEKSLNETYAKVVSRLHQSLAGFHESNRLEGHSDEILALATSHDCADGSAFVVSGAKDGQVIVWNNGYIDGKPSQQPALSYSYNGQSSSVAVSSDCREIAAAGLGPEYPLQIWRREGDLIHTLKNAAKINALDYSPDGLWLVSADEQGYLTLWNRNAEKIQSFEAYKETRIVAMQLKQCPNQGQLLLTASAGLNKYLRLWSLNQRLEAHGAPFPATTPDSQAKLKNISLSSDCSLIATGDDSGNIRLYHLDGGLYKTWQAHDGPIRSIDFSQDGQFLATAGQTNFNQALLSNDNSIKLWKLNADSLTEYERNSHKQQLVSAFARFDGHRDAITVVAFRHDSQQIISASADKTLRVWTINSVPIMDKRDWGYTAMNTKISSDGNRVMAIRADNKIEIYDFPSKNTIVLANEANLDAYFAGRDNTVYILNKVNNSLSLAGSNNNNLISGYTGQLAGLVFNPDGKIIALINVNGSGVLWNVESKQAETLHGLKTSETLLAFSSKGEGVASVSNESKSPLIKYQSVTGGASSEFPASGQENIKRLVFSADGKMLATASQDRLIKLWSVTGQEISTLIGHDSEVVDIAFHPEGKMLASADFDGTIILWSLNGKQLTHLNNQAIRKIKALQFSGDGKWLIGVSLDSVKRWKLDLKELMQLACVELNSYLTTNPKVSESEKKLCGQH